MARPTLAKVTFNPVEVLDLTQDPTGATGVIPTSQGVVEFSPDVSPASRAFEGRRMLFEEGLVSLVAIALDRALVVLGKDGFQAMMTSSGVPVVGDAALWPGGFHHPEVSLFGLPMAGGEVTQRGFVNLQVGMGEEFPVDRLRNRLEMEGG